MRIIIRAGCFNFLLTIVLILLKITKVITWCWLLVLSPILICYLLPIIFILFVYILSFFTNDD